MKNFFEIRRVHTECWKVYMGGVFLGAWSSEYKAKGKVYMMQAALRKHLVRALSAEPDMTEKV